MGDEAARRILFVTGTDTGVGKTWVTCGVARSLVEAGLEVAVRKPAESGCARVDGELLPADAVALRTAAGSRESLEEICAVRLEEPLAPAVAAQRAGQTIDVDAMVSGYRAAAERWDAVLVEGAGGLLVPLADGVSYADLAVALGGRVLVVTAARLGAINHTLLTLEAVRARGLEVAGVVVNHVAAEEDLATRTLAETLADLDGTPVLGSVPHGADPARHLPLLFPARR